MSAVNPSSHPARSLEEVLRGWLPSRRWFPFDGDPEQLSLETAAVIPLSESPAGASPEDEGLAIHLLRAGTPSGTRIVQVPLETSASAFDQQIGSFETSAGTRHVREAVDQPEFLDAVLGLLRKGSQIGGRRAAMTGAANDSLTPVSGVKAAEQVQVIAGEQSNTSVVLRPVEPGEDALILKFFRILGEGENPDVEVGRELTDLGCSVVARTWGWAEITWPETGDDDGQRQAVGQSIVAAEFVDGAQDAWRLAVEAAAEGRSFAAEARELGRATARMHRDLASAFGTQEALGPRREALLESLSGRLEWARDQMGDRPGGLEQELDSVIARAREVEQLPELQRIHGDYHLGQVLRGPDGAFRILDFEGEPLREMSERSAADLPLRDVVGMLRSLDYAAAFGQRESGRDTEQWGQAAAEALLEGWTAVTHTIVERRDPLFQALWLDKAMYEVVYESRNRPDWVDVPLRAVLSALGGSQSSAAVDPAAGAAAGALSGDQETADEPSDVRGTGGTASEASGAPVETSAVVAGPSAAAAGVPSQYQADQAIRGGAEPTPDQQEGSAPEPPAAAPQAETDETSGSEHHVSHTISEDVLAAVAEGRYYDPHCVLGAHPQDDGTVVVRTLRRFAQKVEAITGDGSVHLLSHEWGGIFTGRIPATSDGGIPDYRLRVTWDGGHSLEVDDPYRSTPTVGEMDLHLIGEGRHEELWKVLGARVRSWPSSFGETRGTSFAVWAPNARAVRVIGDFNGWDGTEHAMRSLGGSGVWELFVPGVGHGAIYKFRIMGPDGQWKDKADPMARWSEVPPLTGSRVLDSEYTFGDDEWMERRAQTDPHSGPMSVYEVHIGSWRQGLSYRDLATELVDYVKAHGFTHVEFMPVAEHPFGGSWGYQVTGYYAPTSRFGDPDDFKHLVDALHQAGIGVLVDWVPGHFPKDDFALARFDGAPLYEHPDPRRGEHKDWGTLIFDYGRTEVRNFLVANALYWLEEFHVDGLRVDAVASMLYLDYSREHGEWEPNQFGGRENLEAISFLQEATATAYRRSPGTVMIAEESTAFPGVTRPTSGNGLGFGIKWNMGWMHDSLEYMGEDPVNRSYHHGKLTFSMVYAYSENFILPISHDEVVYGKGSLLRKMPGDRWQQLANVRAYLAYMWAHPGKQLIFMGTEFAQDAEWDNDKSLDWWLAETEPHQGIQRLVVELNEIYKQTPALWAQDNAPEGFNWLDANDSQGCTMSFVRWDTAGEPLVCAVNFAGMPHNGFHLPLPRGGQWEEVLNTDDLRFGGSGVVNGSVTAVDEPQYAQPAHAVLDLPPLGAVWLRPTN
ncbi:1,4-alpha-glucan branching protein GlgB [Kocuria palustris]|jgi:1,4-alpha-glucan branching enzyme|uniref:1,4-alpha-glucan branching protein GlgB n=1 Tax=Kocuria palustris TaxID=71999 RepID=UPI0019D0DDAE|nr:1,4-alpha-glucan branching protein GlgB [Kocuria palustris]MBN6753876.1 1,4-alpha-glucan branching protein GlgB [Kocuria palustris]MBN6758846.1 1,4-alpha-glucan branching protein GlgB [Kocuria palustris]MBN6764103.1 1,4-alpha-glucan branching protein GlgB [Kocuria palustris]MBN6783350.1 1,4-alpha-glucan branching protein GlgB [Kocuria palustris]MBN6800070.1 1,4-alpha-glucan branching protein GlgB [Kocuria palustris]